MQIELNVSESVEVMGVDPTTCGCVEVLFGQVASFLCTPGCWCFFAIGVGMHSILFSKIYLININLSYKNSILLVGLGNRVMVSFNKHSMVFLFSLK